jgi:leader peptidase (prepilin peptidase)/N-methyltransferase
MPAPVRRELSPLWIRPGGDDATMLRPAEGDGLTRPGIAVASIGLIAAGAAAASVLAVPDLRGLLGAGLAMLMLAIAVIDARSFIVPNVLTAAAFGLGVVHAATGNWDTVGVALAVALLRAAIPALIFLAIKISYRRLRGMEGLGWGDVKLAGVAGIWLDWATLPIAVEMAALAAIAFYVLRQYLWGRSIRLTSRLPFGLFLAPAIWLSWLLEARLIVPFY